eukprot:1325128-Prymnesium_polylepis.2
MSQVPMLNPDGVAFGHCRADARGIDLNRMYAQPSHDEQPSVHAALAVAQQLHGRGDLYCYIDAHAHGNRRGCFFYANALPTESARQDAALYARLVALNARCEHSPGLFWMKLARSRVPSRACASASACRARRRGLRVEEVEQRERAGRHVRDDGLAADVHARVQLRQRHPRERAATALREGYRRERRRDGRGSSCARAASRGGGAAAAGGRSARERQVHAGLVAGDWRCACGRHPRPERRQPGIAPWAARGRWLAAVARVLQVVRRVYALR